MNLRFASIIGYFFMVLALASLVYERSILAQGYVLIMIQIIAVVLMGWARITFGRRSFHAGANPTKGGLMTAGPYRFIRHPIYASILYFLWAGVFSHLSILNLLLVVVCTIGVSIRIFAEEHLIVLEYPEYIHYASRTKRIVPFLI